MEKAWKGTIVIGFALLLGLKLIFDMAAKTSIIETEISNIPVGISLGEQAPDFEGTTLSGDTIRLSELRGKTVVLNVFQTSLTWT